MTAHFPRFTHLPAPRHCPDPDPAYPCNEGREIAAVCHLLGSSLQPWQRMTINRATQYRPARDIMGRPVREYKYSKVLVTVPRQSGKTFLTGPLQIWRLLRHPGEGHLYTAQTGADAGARMRELLAMVSESPSRALFRPRYSNGSEGLSVVGTGASLTRFSPTLSSVHGGHPPLVTLDEIWKYTGDLGSGLLGAIGPSQVTVRQKAQIWMVSTKGTAKSEFMNELIEQGINGTDPSLCYIEFSMPDGADPYDPQTWWGFHPALGNTISEESLRADMGLPYAEWMRGYMNVVVSADNPIIALEDWDHLAEQTPALPSLNDCAIAYEVAGGGECAAVVAAWRDPLTLTPHIKVLAQRPGTAWLVPYLAMLTRRWPAAHLYADDGGPTRRITDHLTDTLDTDRLTTLTMTERGVADGNLLASVTETGALRHDGSQALRMAVANAAMRTTNAVERLDRDKSTAPIAALIAASVALWGTDHAADAWTVPAWATEA